QHVNIKISPGGAMKNFLRVSLRNGCSRKFYCSKARICLEVVSSLRCLVVYLGGTQRGEGKPSHPPGGGREGETCMKLQSLWAPSGDTARKKKGELQNRTGVEEKYPLRPGFLRAKLDGQWLCGANAENP
ncbi:hypothetical protein E2320_000247, partial [Naja naja]